MSKILVPADPSRQALARTSEAQVIREDAKLMQLIAHLAERTPAEVILVDPGSLQQPYGICLVFPDHRDDELWGLDHVGKLTERYVSEVTITIATRESIRRELICRPQPMKKIIDTYVAIYQRPKWTADATAAGHHCNDYSGDIWNHDSWQDQLPPAPNDIHVTASGDIDDAVQWLQEAEQTLMPSRMTWMKKDT